MNCYAALLTGMGLIMGSFFYGYEPFLHQTLRSTADSCELDNTFIWVKRMHQECSEPRRKGQDTGTNLLSAKTAWRTSRSIQQPNCAFTEMGLHPALLGLSLQSTNERSYHWMIPYVLGEMVQAALHGRERVLTWPSLHVRVSYVPIVSGMGKIQYRNSIAWQVTISGGLHHMILPGRFISTAHLGRPSPFSGIRHLQSHIVLHRPK